MTATIAAIGASAAALGFSLAPLSAQSPPSQSPPGRVVLRNPDVIGPVVPGRFDGDLRNRARAPQWREGDPVREVNPRQEYPRGRPPADPAAQPSQTPPLDPLFGLQMRFSSGAPDRAFSTPTVNVAGQGFSGSVPPDTVGDVGQTYYIQMINTLGGADFAVYDKSDGSLVAGPTRLDTLVAGGDCANGGGDPIVLYDELAGRWLLSEFTPSGGGNKLCVYVSQTGDPISGGWYRYEFQAPNFPDYPKYAVWPDAYYASSNEPGGPAVYALDRTQMLAGAAATMQRFTGTSLAGFGFQAFIPSDHDGGTAPPAGAPNYFMRHRDDEAHSASGDPSSDFLEIWEFAVDFATPANSTFSGPSLPVSEFDSDLCGLSSFFCFPQPGTAITLDPLREVVMWRLQYRNFGTHETLVGNLVTDVDGTDRGGIRWFELRKVGAGGWTLYQEGTHSPDAAHRWMGSIAMDGSGNIAVGYSISATSVSPSIRYTGRLATDTLGAMPQGEHSIADGLASQTSSVRWGDYSSMSVDPVDDCTFWYTNEYTPTGNWATRIAAFKFDSCTGSLPPPPPPPPPTRTLTITKAGTGSGTVTSAPAGIACGATCAAGFADGTVVTLSVVVDPGSTLVGYGGDADCLDGSVTMNADLACTVTIDLAASPPPAPPAPTDPQVANQGSTPLDLDGDGRGDAVRYSFGAGGATSYLENGVLEPGPAAPVLASSVSHAWSPGWSIHGGDFNGDGRADLLLYDATGGAWFKAISTTLPGGPVSFDFFGDTWSPGWSVGVVDLDADGLDDVFLYNTLTGQYFRAISTGDGTADFAYTPGLWSPSWLIVPLDLDGDGLVDMFTYNSTTGFWYRAINDGADDFVCHAITCQAPQPKMDRWSADWQLHRGDFDGDGLTDLLLYSATTGAHYVAFNDGADFTYVFGMWSPGWTVATGELNGDGRTDVFLYDAASGVWFEGFADGAGGFGYSQGLWSPGWSVHLTDFDADGRDDVLLYNVTSGAYFQGINTGPGSFDFTGGTWSANDIIIANRP